MSDASVTGTGYWAWRGGRAPIAGALRVECSWKLRPWSLGNSDLRFVMFGGPFSALTRQAEVLRGLPHAAFSVLQVRGLATANSAPHSRC